MTGRAQARVCSRLFGMMRFESSTMQAFELHVVEREPSRQSGYGSNTMTRCTGSLGMTGSAQVG